MSRDFPATPGALQTAFQADSYQAFVAKLDAEGRIEYQSFVGGSSNTNGRDISATAAGEVLLTGQTVGDGFPITPGAAVASTDTDTTYLAKIDRTGATLLVGLRGIGGRIVVADAQDNIYVAGSAYGEDPVPVTPGAFQTTHTLRGCAGTGFVGIACFYGYVAKLNAAGDQVLFATFVTGAFGSDIAAMHVDADGNVLIAGTTNSPDYPVTPGALLDRYIASAEPPPLPPVGRPPIRPPPAAGYVTKLNNTGSELLFSTYFSGTESDSITGMAVGTESIYVAGNASSADLPGLDTPAQCIPSPYVSQITADGSAVVATQLVDRSPSNLQLALPPDSAPYLAGFGLGSSILQVDFSARSEAVACVLDAANLLHAETVAPGRLLSLFGKNLAPSVETGRPSESGVLPTSLGGLTVAFDGLPAPLLYASPEQVNLQVPHEVATEPAVAMEIAGLMIENGNAAAPRRFTVVPRVPTAFIHPFPELTCNDVVPQVVGGAHYPVARNADGSLNRCANPAAPRSVVTIFLHGVGVTQPPQRTGAVTGDQGVPLGVPVSFRSSEIEFVSAQSHPGAIASVWEVQFRLPQTNSGFVAVEPVVDGMLVAPGGLVIWVER